MQGLDKYRDRVLRRFDERDRIKARGAEEKSHLQDIMQAKDRQRTGFWCSNCKKDFEAEGYKRVGYLTHLPTAWYTAKCVCGRWAIRRITGKRGDMYYYKSKMIRTQKVQMANDLLMPGDPMFEIIYAKQYREMEKKRYESETTTNA